jgi:hypothetical protein
VGGSYDEDEGRKGTQEALKGYTDRRRSVGRARGRWTDAVDRNAKRM